MMSRIFAEKRQKATVKSQTQITIKEAHFLIATETRKYTEYSVLPWHKILDSEVKLHTGNECLVVGLCV